ncbi:metal-dependent hydrolase with the TIM-barrel fold protein [candidate division KSB1 bacterium]|nr:MAG: metal-dependent hydrolase with the TIM-barrel fold protein [candidate division KSB1 bacterium]
MPMRVFKNAEFISCEDKNRVFQYLVEDAGTIVFTGDTLPPQYAACEAIDLTNKCVVPAFGDTHIHFSSFAFFHSGLDCRDVEDFEQLGKLINSYIARGKKEKIILAFGCSAHTVKEKRLPDKSDLDKITDKPLMIVKYDGHASVGNSALIKKMPTAVLADPGFDKDTGWFYLNAFYRAVNYISQSVSLPALFRNLLAGSDYLAQKGISLVHPAEGVGFPLDLDVDFMRLANRGLPQTYRIFFQTMDIKKVLRRGLPRIGGCFATALDGCFGSEDAALTESYTNNPKNHGTLFYTQEEVNDFAIKANRASLQLAMHAIGDAAINQALTAYEAALKDYPRGDHRHIIIHADLMSSETIEKAAKLNLCIALQTPFLYWRQEPVEYLEGILGKQLKNLIPLKSMLKAGLTLANGSDAPCTLPDPIAGIYAACNHPNPDESISALDALRLHTANCTKLSFDEKTRGTLTEGKLADFAVLDKNPLAMPVEKLNTIKIDALYLKGEKYDSQRKRTITNFLFDSISNKYPL